MALYSPCALIVGSGSGESPVPEPPTPPRLPLVLEEEGIALLCSDALSQIFMHLNAFSLVRMSAVCTSWRSTAQNDELWARAAQQRWRLAAKAGRYKYGERSWREVYRVFHRRNRIPIYPGIGQREVVYACGRKDRVAVWLLINHLPACRLAERALHGETHSEGALCRVLSCRVAVQNLRDSPIEVDAMSGLALTMRDGSVSRPLLGAGGPTAAKAAAEEAAAPVAAWPACARPLRLAPLEVGMLADVAFPAHSQMRFEPDILEAAHSLRVRAAVVGQCVALEVPCAFADEGTIWDHYELITREFYVHRDREE